MKVYAYIKNMKSDDYDWVELRIFDDREKARRELKADRDKVIDHWRDKHVTIDYDTPDMFIVDDGEDHDYFTVEERELE